LGFFSPAREICETPFFKKRPLLKFLRVFPPGGVFPGPFPEVLGKVGKGVPLPGGFPGFPGVSGFGEI